MNTPTFSKIIAGCMSWGRWGESLSKEAIAEKIDFCFSQGISTFDHADIYGDYTTEKDFGEGLFLANTPREQIQLITKCGIQKVSQNRLNNKVKHYQYDGDYITLSVENSLRNLQTDYIDILLLHRPSPLMNPEEIAKTITTLLEEGKIKSFGVSNFTPSQIALLEKYICVSCNQIEMSLNHHIPTTDNTLDYHLSQKIKTMAWAPLGNYFKTESTQNIAIKQVVNNIKNQYGLEDYQLLIAWLLKHPANIYPVIGTTNNERIQKISQTIHSNLDLQDWFAMYEAALGNRIP